MNKLIQFVYKLISPKKKSGVYRFYQEYSASSHVKRRWYIDLPKYPGPKAALEMVAGADFLLDYLAEDKDEVSLKISLENDGSYEALQLCTTEQTTEGRWYEWGIHPLWLCDVVLYVFGNFPNTIYFKVV